MLSLSEARARVRARIQPLPIESASLAHAQRRYLAKDVVAPLSLPLWDNSAMDGFAVRSSELPGTLPVDETIAAGDAPGASLAPGTTRKIMTGAPVPAGADAIVMREEVRDDGDTATFQQAPPVGDNIRRHGEDIRAGDVIVRAGTALMPGELSALAGLGVTTVELRRRPRVALLASGDELVPLGSTLGPGQKINSSAVALSAAIELAGGEVVSDFIAEDTEDAIHHAMRSALEQCDVLLTTGGVSVGDFDFVRSVAPSVGIDVDFWKVAIKPGKPLVFGSTKRAQLYFGLPGNPISTLINFELFVRPTLLALAGAARCERAQVEVELTTSYSKRPGRTHIVPASLSREGARLLADTSRKQGSATLSSMVRADALVEFPESSADYAAGTSATALLLDYA